MSSTRSISTLEIFTDKMRHDSKTKTLSIEILDFTFIGHYDSNTRLKKILDDIHACLEDLDMQRENIKIIDSHTQKPLLERMRLKDIVFEEKVLDTRDKKEKKLLRKDREKEPEEGMGAKSSEIIPKKVASIKKKIKEENYISKELLEEEREEGEKKGGPLPPPPPRAPVPVRKKLEKQKETELEHLMEKNLMTEDEARPIEGKQERSLITYEINMGFQYYAVMMEQKRYLFYIYFSHKELRIMDEEGKTIHVTKISIITTKKEPPILDLRIEGTGFEIHPLAGRVEVRKDIINPPVIIFSISPIKKEKRTRAEKIEGERRFLNIYVEFEGKTISHVVLSVIVQPKHFHLNLGPLQIDINKSTALFISFLSVVIITASVFYSIFSFEDATSSISVLESLSPSIASIAFILSYAFSILKGLRPLKRKWSKFLNFDKTSTFVK
ncbi:MAG: hypothetical protein ACTSXH_02195 [Promethearchaeota archaeon]